MPDVGGGCTALWWLCIGFLRETRCGARCMRESRGKGAAPQLDGLASGFYVTPAQGPGWAWKPAFRVAMEDSVSRTNFALAALAVTSVVAIAPSAASAQAPAAFTDAAAAAPAESTDDTAWTVQLGGTLNMGNTRSFQLAGGTHFMVRRNVHLFQMDFAFTYGLAALRNANGEWSDFDAIAQNINGKVRYDLFFDPDWSIFAVASGRNDPFAGLDFRVQGQLGVSRSLLRQSDGEHRLWVELGADITYDDVSPNPSCAAGTTAVAGSASRFACSNGATPPVLTSSLPGSRQHYAGRLFLGYDNHMNDTWRYQTGVEGIVGALVGNAFADNMDEAGEPTTVPNARINWTNELGLNLVEGLAVSLRFNLFYELVPAAGRDNVDTQTILSLQYTLM